MATVPAGKPGRAEALAMWLEAVNARELWSTTLKTPQVSLTMYSAHGRTFIVHKFLDRAHSFDVLIPASDENSVAATLAAARDFIVNGSAKRTGPIGADELTEIGERITLDQLDELKAMFP